MTETLTIRLPKSLARDLRAKASAAKTNPSAVLRRAALDFVKSSPAPSRNAMQEHIRARAGSWDGFVSGASLLKKTRP